ncbi:hypothetical protein T10_10650 [Trichinella papuae]|uniref:Uncharacterized protein n=1 Tax=Trichinella papuae TaxID=268474 RepID=A0A0V1MNQ0_9BILA|nr:hypothetical protein T10_10650 [Trichinella papuae]
MASGYEVDKSLYLNLIPEFDGSHQQGLELSEDLLLIGHFIFATHRCQMKRHAEFWTATKKDDNLTALDQENMVGERSPIDKHRDVEVGSFLLDFQVQWVAFAANSGRAFARAPKLSIDRVLLTKHSVVNYIFP